MAQPRLSNTLTDAAIYEVWDHLETAISQVLDGVADRRLLDFFASRADGAAFLQNVASDALDRFDARRAGVEPAPPPLAQLALVGGRAMHERG